MAGRRVEPKRVNVRVIAATNADLTDMVAQGSFRRDLFYRLNVLVLQVPPLREHPEDVPALFEMMVDTLQRRTGKRLKLALNALELLAHYSFPGNVRELWNIVERVPLVPERARWRVRPADRHAGGPIEGRSGESHEPAPGAPEGRG